MRLLGGIFDIDGVLLDTPHEHAWRLALDQLMRGAWRDVQPQTTYTTDALTSAVYQEQIAGKPRDDGARSALTYFHVPDPDGERERQYAAQKQQVLLQLARTGEVRAYADAVRFLLAVKAAGVRVCAASSSKNADEFLRQIALERVLGAQGGTPPGMSRSTTLLDLFDADVDGRHMQHGKPAPDLFLAAARQLGYAPEQCFVVEDAPAGIEAAKAGGMFAVGVARQHDAAGLRAARADIVVTSLDAVDVGQMLRE